MTMRSDGPRSARAALLALVRAGGAGVVPAHVPDDAPHPERVVIVGPGAPGEIRRGDVLLVVGTHPDDPAGIELTLRAGRAEAAAVVFRSSAVGERALCAAGAAGVALLRGEPSTRWAGLKAAWDAQLAVAGAPRAAAATTSGIEVLLDTLGQATRRNLLVLSPALDLLSYATPEPGAADEVHAAAIVERRLPDAAAQQLRRSAVLTTGRAGVALSRTHHATAVFDATGEVVLGYVWAQRLHPDRGLAPHADPLELIADALVRMRSRQAGELDLAGRDLRAVLRGGGAATSALAAALDVRPGEALVVIAVRRVPRNSGQDADHRPARSLQIVASTGRALRIRAVQTALGDVIYVLAVRRPDVRTDRMVAFGTRVRWEIEQAIGGLVLVGVGEEVADLGGVGRSREQADRVLNALAHRDGPRVATLPMVAGAALLDEIRELLRDVPSLQRGALRELAADPELIRTLRGYLDAFGDIGRAADALHVHPNTLRYRLRRIARAGIDLSSAKERAVLSLQLRAADT